MSELKYKILQQIKDEKITPKSRWVFSTIRTLVWSSIVFSMIIGSISIAIVTFALTDTDWDLYQRIHKSFFEYVIFLLPYFWIAGMIIFAILGYFAFRKTTGGYRMMPYLIVFGGFVISLVCGLMLYGLGFGETLHDYFLQKVPQYDKFIITDKDIWSDPDDGLISGRLVLLPATTSLSLYDWDGGIWLVTKNSSTIVFGNGAPLQNGEMVKIIGKVESTSTFAASEIRPWHRPRKFVVPCVINGICPRSK